MAGRLPSELMPPIENDLAASDFDDAVALHLYLFERRSALDDLKSQAQLIAAASGSGGAGKAGVESEFFTPEAEEYLERAVNSSGFGPIFNGE